MRKIASLGIVIVAYAAAQTPDAPVQFEVASIKPSPPPTGRGMRIGMRGGPGTNDPGLFHCENCGLSGLVAKAFGIQEFQLSGPDWMQLTRFNVSAKIPTGATKEQFQLMLQNLLAERFKMTFHRGQKQMQRFELTVAKNGPKFKPSVEPPASDDDAPRQPGPMKRDANGVPVLPSGQGFAMVMSGERADLRFGGSIPEFALRLSRQLGQPIADATGLDGKYDISLSWVPGESRDDPGTLFQALQEQLGLKLESKKGMVDIVVVDHIEKTPTEN